jgi:hypothetical protein
MRIVYTLAAVAILAAVIAFDARLLFDFRPIAHRRYFRVHRHSS